MDDASIWTHPFWWIVSAAIVLMWLLGSYLRDHLDDEAKVTEGSRDCQTCQTHEQDLKKLESD